MNFLKVYRQHVDTCHARADAALVADAKLHWLEMAKYWQERVRLLERQAAATQTKPASSDQRDQRILI